MNAGSANGEAGGGVARDAIHIAYDAVEDRLVLSAFDAVGEARTAALTRRLVGGLLDALGQMLEATSPLARVVPPGIADDVARSEHRDAVRSHKERHAPQASSVPPAPVDAYVGAGALPLVTRVVIDPIEGGGVALAIETGDIRLTALRLGRSEAHALLESLRTRAEGVGWGLSLETRWLDPA